MNNKDDIAILQYAVESLEMSLDDLYERLEETTTKLDTHLISAAPTTPDAPKSYYRWRQENRTEITKEAEGWALYKVTYTSEYLGTLCPTELDAFVFKRPCHDSMAVTGRCAEAKANITAAIQAEEEEDS